MGCEATTATPPLFRSTCGCVEARARVRGASPCPLHPSTTFVRPSARRRSSVGMMSTRMIASVWRHHVATIRSKPPAQLYAPSIPHPNASSVLSHTPATHHPSRSASPRRAPRARRRRAIRGKEMPHMVQARHRYRWRTVEDGDDGGESGNAHEALGTPVLVRLGKPPCASASTGLSCRCRTACHRHTPISRWRAAEAGLDFGLEYVDGRGRDSAQEDSRLSDEGARPS